MPPARLAPETPLLEGQSPPVFGGDALNQTRGCWGWIDRSPVNKRPITRIIRIFLGEPPVHARYRSRPRRDPIHEFTYRDAPGPARPCERPLTSVSLSSGAREPTQRRLGAPRSPSLFVTPQRLVSRAQAALSCPSPHSPSLSRTSGEAHELKSPRAQRVVHQYPGSIRPSIHMSRHGVCRHTQYLLVASSTSAPAPALFRTRQTTLPFTSRHHHLVTDDEGPPARLMPVSATVPSALQQGGSRPRPHELRRTCPPPLRNGDRLRPQRADLLFMPYVRRSRHGDLLRN